MSFHVQFMDLCKCDDIDELKKLYIKDLKYEHFAPVFFTINQPLAIQNTGTQIQKVILYSKTGLKRSF